MPTAKFSRKLNTDYVTFLDDVFQATISYGIQCQRGDRFMQLIETALESDKVKLVPMRVTHKDALLQAASDGKLWKLWFTSVPNEDAIDSYIDTALEQQGLGLSLPYVVIDKQSNTLIDSTRLCNADRHHRRVEIGYTWYAQSFQRSWVNTECKLLLLTHAFETLNTIAVEFRTHWHNQKSRTAIARLGAKQDGILRSHQVLADGSIRDTVVFSIIANEWPAVKNGLVHKLSAWQN